MSDLTRCNYCSLLEYKKRAKAKGQRVIIRNGGFGRCVYVVPKLLSIKDFNALPVGSWQEKTGKGKYKVSEMMEIPQGCCC